MAQRTIKEYRHALAVLKKAGLISGVDARSAKPTPALTRKINRFKNVISGEAEVLPAKKVPLNPQQLRASNAELVKPKGLPPKVVVSKRKSEKVTIESGGIARTGPHGIKRLTIPIPYRNLEQYLDNLADPKNGINQLKGPNGWFSFRFFGNNSRRSFRTIGQLVQYFSQYESVSEAIDEDNSKDMMDIYQALEIVTIPENEKASFQEDRNVTREERRAKKNAEKQARYRTSRSEAQKERDKEAAKKRAKKSRQRKK